LQETLTLG